MPPNRFESEVESFLEGSHGDRTHIKRADHHTVTPLCGTLLVVVGELHYLNAFVEDLAAQSDASVTDRVTVLAEHMVASSPQSGLGRANWVSEVPEALLESLRNTLTKLAPHLEQMLRQGIESGEIGCAFPREVAEVLVLLVDVWVDPLIVAESYERMCQKVDFIAAFLKRFDAQVLSEEAIAVIKNGVGHFYE